MTFLTADLVVHRGQFTLDAGLTADRGEVLALLGPNGAGKTTALRTLAGLSRLHSGAVSVGGTEWEAPDRNVFVAPQRRSVGVVFQEYLLFPHLSALENVAFGPRSRGTGKATARRTAAAWLDRVGLADRAGDRPSTLSGGQAQRVALARALAPEPDLLLLDEPLAALDAHTRQELRADLRRHLAGTDRVTLLVTHDPLDAMVLADRIVVVEDGRVVQRGTATEITRYPRTEYVARLVGLNLFRGSGTGHEVTVPDGFTLTCAESVHGPAFVAFAPSAVAVFADEPAGSPRNRWAATVSGLERYGDSVRLRLEGQLTAAADVTAAAAAELGLIPGARVWAAVKATETHAYPR